MIVSRHREERSRALLNMKISYFIVIISQIEGPAKRSVCDVMEHVMWLLPIIVFFSQYSVHVIYISNAKNASIVVTCQLVANFMEVL